MFFRVGSISFLLFLVISILIELTRDLFDMPVLTMELRCFSKSASDSGMKRELSAVN